MVLSTDIRRMKYMCRFLISQRQFGEAPSRETTVMDFYLGMKCDKHRGKFCELDCLPLAFELTTHKLEHSWLNLFSSPGQLLFIS